MYKIKNRKQPYSPIVIVRIFSVLSLVGILFFSNSCSQKEKKETKEKRPNILFFITDDESWIERSAYGWSKLPTPHFDQVAKKGAIFENAFTSAPSCAPSRASVLTGRNFWELEQGTFIQSYLPEKFPLFTTILAQNGYQVGHTAKIWGPGVFLKGGHSKVSGTSYNEAGVAQAIKGISNNDYAGNFELFLQDKKKGQPFFFWAGIIEPHLPNGPENYKRLEAEYGLSLDAIKLMPGIEDTQNNRKDRANYLYEIAYTDLHLGRMIASLKAMDELDNTLIVVTSDNGTPVTKEGEQVGKASAYDLGVHIPMAMMWPSRIKAERTVNDFVSFTDLAPTFLEIAGIQPPEDMSGKSLLPILDSKKSGRIEPQRDFIITGLEWHGEFDPDSKSSRSIRTDRFAYISNYNNVAEDGTFLTNEEAIKPVKVEFYDMENDPWQLTDLSADPDYSDAVERLAKKLHQNGIQTKDPRITGEMDIFIKTRQYVQKRKKLGYEETLTLPFSD